jgi:hypothetical protein
MKRESVRIVIILILVATETVFADLSSGLVAYYPFSGDATDATGSGHDGTVYGGATLTIDRFGNPNSAYSFDGIDGYIELSNAQDFAFGSSFSVSLWGTVAQNTNSYDPLIWIGGSSASTPSFTIMKSRSGWSEGRLYAQTLPPKVEVFSTVIGSEIPTDQWMHLVATVDRSTYMLSFYVDDIFQGTTSIGSFDLSSFSPMLTNIGCDTWVSGADYHYGLIDDVRIYNRVLSRSEITELNVIPLPPAMLLGCIGLAVASWRLRRMKRSKQEAK